MGRKTSVGADCNYNFWSYWWVVETTRFSYDSVGNRRDQGGTYGTGNRIQSFAGCGYTTDPDGNVTARSCPGGTLGITWNADNWPTQMTVNGTTVDLYYDPYGRLVRKQVNGTLVSYFLWDGDQLYAEERGTDGNVRTQYSYYPGQDRLHAVLVGSTGYYAQEDGQGNVSALTDGAGPAPVAYSYDPWGAGSTSFADSNRARFKGALWLGPEVDLYYMRNRWYEPKTGRFLSEDPLGLEGGINPYVYAGDDPIDGADPAGLHTQDRCLSTETEVSFVGPDVVFTAKEVACPIAGFPSLPPLGEAIYYTFGGHGSYGKELRQWRETHPDLTISMFASFGLQCFAPAAGTYLGARYGLGYLRALVAAGPASALVTSATGASALAAQNAQEAFLRGLATNGMAARSAFALLYAAGGKPQSGWDIFLGVVVPGWGVLTSAPAAARGCF